MQTFASKSRALTRALAAGFLAAACACPLPMMAQQNAAAAVAAVPADVPADAGYAKEINAFLAADRKQAPPSEGVLFIGSSTIRMWETLARDIPELPVINRGFGGSQVRDSTLYADRIAIPYKPKMIVFFAGTNDMASGRSPQQVFEDFQAFEAKIHAALPDTRLVYLSISPTVARWKQQSQVLEANYLIEKFIFENGTATRKMNFIDTHAQLLSADGKPQPALLREDGLHLNAEGYKVYTSIIKPRVLALAALDGVKRLDAQPAAAAPAR